MDALGGAEAVLGVTDGGGHGSCKRQRAVVLKDVTPGLQCTRHTNGKETGARGVVHSGEVARIGARRCWHNRRRVERRCGGPGRGTVIVDRNDSAVGQVNVGYPATTTPLTASDPMQARFGGQLVAWMEERGWTAYQMPTIIGSTTDRQKREATAASIAFPP